MQALGGIKKTSDVRIKNLFLYVNNYYGHKINLKARAGYY
jgi:hypothetical protein